MPETIEPITRRVASWNISNGLTDRERLDVILKGIETIEPDAMVLPEAFDVMTNGDVIYARSRLTEMGYDPIFIAYKDTHPEHRGGRHISRQAMCVIGRVSIGATVERIRLGDRNAARIELVMGSKIVRVAGVHYDDRSEELRIPAVEATIRDNPDLIIGDNNMLPTSGLVTTLVGSHAYESWLNYAFIPERQRNLAERLGRMADGRGMQLLAEAGYEDCDTRKQPTMRFAGRPIAQLDRAMARRREGIQVSSTQVHNLPGSDHLPISVDITVAA